MDEQAASSTREHHLPLSVVILAGMITRAANGVRDDAIDNCCNSQRPDNCGTGEQSVPSPSSSLLASDSFSVFDFFGDATGPLCDLCQ